VTFARLTSPRPIIVCSTLLFFTACAAQTTFSCLVNALSDLFPLFFLPSVLALLFSAQHKGDRYPVGIEHDDAAGAHDEPRRRRFAYHPEYRVKKTQKWKRMLPDITREDPTLA